MKLISARRLLVCAAVLLAAISSAVILWRPTSPPPNRAFYYWKTQWAPSPGMLESLKANSISRLYLRYFDVGWDEAARKALPVSPLEFVEGPPEGVTITPVVYLVNNVFLKIAYADIEELAGNVYRKIETMSRHQGIAFNEIQIDCDWTEGTRRNYFHFAELLGRKLKAERKTLSSTIRLHQVKYAGRTGIPPVGRGMLMFYNFGKIRADSPRSSIFNAEDAGLYASFIENYTLPLDVVLPLFSWSIHSREGEVLGLLEKLRVEELNAVDGFRSLAPNRYSATRSFFFRGRYFMEGDLLVVEETTPEMTRQAAAMAKRGAGHKAYETVALFDLDEKQLDTFDVNAIGGVLNAF